MPSNNLRVLLVSDMSKVGGTEVATYISAKQLVNQVPYVGVFGKSGPFSKEVEALGVENFDAEAHTKNPLAIMNYVKKLCQVIKDKDINVIHAQMARPVPLIWLAKTLTGRKGLKIFWTSRGLDHETYGRIVPMFNKMGVRGIGNCKMEQQKLIRYGYEPANTDYVYNAYRLNPETAVREKPATPPFVIGTLSSLRPVRRVDLFIEMAKELVKHPVYGHQVKFLIGGSGSEMSALQELVKTYQLEDKVTFFGNVSDVEAFMQQVHVYVSPLVIEGDGGAGLSNSIIEAMVTKTPVCSYEAIAHGEIVIDGETGFLIEANNNQALVNAVIETLDNPAATTKRVENAYANIIEQCDPNSFSKKLISLYEQM